MTKIEWTERTWNPTTGCTKVSAGCKHCYAERMWPRLNAPGQPYEWREFGDVALHPDRLPQPLRWRKPSLVFVDSMSDLFHESLAFEQIASVFDVMARAGKHTFQVLTKRPARMLWFLGQLGAAGKQPAPNIWLGVSVEDQATADERIPLLLQTPAAVRFVSAEPLLGPVDLEPWLYGACVEHDLEFGGEGVLTCGGHRGFDWLRHLHWVIVGGESGPQARPMHPEWARSIRDQCAAAGVPYFFKQWGECRSVEIPGEGWTVERVGKRAAGRLLDGVEHDGMPEVSR